MNIPFRRIILLTILAYLCSVRLLAQGRGTVLINGDIYEYMLDDCGDTIILATLSDIAISSMRHFKSPEEYNKYRRYRRYAYLVFPYASEAIRIFRELEHTTATMREGEKKRHIRKLQKELKEKFEDPLRGLTRTQGMILVEMIERELNTPLYELIRDLRGGWNASYWNTMSSLYGYKIREGYIRGKDPILDVVLDDVNFNFAHTYPKK